MDTDRQTKSAETQTDRQKERQTDGQKREVEISTHTFLIGVRDTDRQTKEADRYRSGHAK